MSRLRGFVSKISNKLLFAGNLYSTPPTSYGIKRNIFFVNAGAKFGATAGTSINWIIQEPPFCRLCYVKIREAPKMAKYCPVLLAPSGTRSHKKAFRPKGIIYDIGWWCGETAI